MINNTIENSYKKALQYNGIACKINDKDSKGLFRDGLNNNIETGINYNLFISDTKINVGDHVSIGSDKYLVVNKIDDENIINIYRGNIAKTRPILVYEENSASKLSVNAICSSFNSIQIDTNLVNIADDRITFVVSDTVPVKVGNIIDFANEQYEVISLDKTIEGLIKARTKYKGISKTYTLTIEPKSAEIEVNKDISINATVKENGVVISNPIIQYTSNDDSIATVSANGMVTAKSKGVATITVSAYGLTELFSIAVVEPVVVKYTIIGDETIRKGTSANYVITPSANVEWTTTDDTVIQIVSGQGTDTVTLKALKSDDYIILSANLDGVEVATLDVFTS